MLRRNKFLILLVAMVIASVVVVALGHFSFPDGKAAIELSQSRPKVTERNLPLSNMYVIEPCSMFLCFLFIPLVF